MGKEEEAAQFIQNRLDEEKVQHAKTVAQILKEKKLDENIIIASILHDTLYLEKTTTDELKEKFGEEITKIVEETTQVQKLIDRNLGKIDSATLAEILLSITTTLEPIIIKVAEAGETLYTGKEKEIEKVAKAGEEIFIPLAIKLGINGIDWRIQDNIFKLKNKQGYEKIKKMVNKTREEREKLILEIKNEIEELLQGKIKAQIYGRPKNFKSIYDKLKKVDFNRMYDLYGLRIICDKEKECYEALGYVHSKFDFIREAFDDYITHPKENGYKSIHTAIIRGKDIIEIQIRTWEQHLRTESSLYWEYKRIKKFKEIDKTLSWERQLLEWQKSAGDEIRKKKAIGKKIFIFTPKNDVIPLTIGATPIDFAFAVHTDIGKKIQKAKINGNYSPLETKLKNLDKVEIILNDKPTVQRSWLNFVVSEKAKTKIKSHFKMKNKKTKITCGKNTQGFKKIKMAECCHPLPGEDVIGVKTTKRKIIIHRKDCKNIIKISKEKLVEIAFEKDKGQSGIRIKAMDRTGLLAEILAEIKKSGGELTSTSFNVKKNGYVEAMFELQIGSAQKMEKLIEKIENIPSIQAVERI